MKMGDFLSQEEMKNSENNTEEAIKNLNNKKEINFTQNGPNNKIYHIAGNGEFNYMCKDCIVSSIKKQCDTFENNELIRLVSIKDEEIHSLKELVKLLKQELNIYKKNAKMNNH